MGAGSYIALFVDDDVISAADAMDSLFYFSRLCSNARNRLY